MAIYAALLVLLWFYCDDMLEPFALSVSSGENEWMVMALGWEIVPEIWPVILLMVVASSAVTFYLTRHFSREKKNSSCRERC
jgi:hypothetical protein